MTFHAPAKVNVFLKITGIRGGYHTIRSRFLRIPALYDTLAFVEKEQPGGGFELRPSIDLPQHNTLTAAYELLARERPEVEAFFRDHAVVLTKRIPPQGGLGGGSSDAATLLRACNEICDLRMPLVKLATLGAQIGADVPFFVHGYASANVEGIGEKIMPFEEEPPQIRLHMTHIACDTAAVYSAFRAQYADTIDPEAGRSWLTRTSADILQSVDPMDANDLFAPALELCPQLRHHRSERRFFSGSGGTFFEMKN